MNTDAAIDNLRGHVAALTVIAQALMSTHQDREALLIQLRELAHLLPAAYDQAAHPSPVMRETLLQTLQVLLTSLEQTAQASARSEVQTASAARRLLQSIAGRPPSGP